MKLLRNKKTGEIAEFCMHKRGEDSEDGNPTYYPFDGSIEEWEDYEEPKEKHWYMTSWGEVWQYGDDPLHEEWRKILGNDFETKEEAEKAVEKLKAWKRLKDNGFRFTSYKDNTDPKGNSYQVNIKAVFDGARFSDLDLLFGGEE